MFLNVPRRKDVCPTPDSGGPVYSFLVVFKEDLKELLNRGAAACGEPGVGSRVVSALSTSRVHLTCPPRGERSSDLTNTEFKTWPRDLGRRGFRFLGGGKVTEFNWPAVENAEPFSGRLYFRRFGRGGRG